MQGRFRSFDGVAQDYDKTRVIPETQLKAIAKICIQSSKLDSDSIFLDAGVGTGRFAVPLSNIAQGRIVGIDISQEMMSMAAHKNPQGKLSLLVGDLRRLPLKDKSVKGALVVHVLHIIEDWKTVLDELCRVIEPAGVLILGTELGGRSVLTDFYFERARARRVLGDNLGATGSAPAITYLRQMSHRGRSAASVELLWTPSLTWTRMMPVRETLDILERSTFTQMWDVPPDHHREIWQETNDFALKTFGDIGKKEALNAKFVMHAIRWPNR